MKSILSTAGALLVTAILAGPALAATNPISSKPFGRMPDGRPVSLYTLTNAHGMQVQITNYGGTVTSLRVPDRRGHLDDVVLGYDTLKEYQSKNNSYYFGALIGRYGNRIANGRFSLNGKTYRLPINNPPNTLHGGPIGFDKVLWEARAVQAGPITGLDLRYVSKDGEMGFPGNMNVHVIYLLMDDNSLHINYSADTDKDTVVNLTHHSYFNLNGAGTGDILTHRATIYADRFTPVNKNLIPTGALQPVAGTPFDFRHSTAIGARINQKNQQLIFGNGYDHNFVLRPHGHHLALAARVYSPKTGREVAVYTTQPGVQFYTGNFLTNKTFGKGGKLYNFRNGFCLETQHYPDAPNHPNFPSTTLKRGQNYSEMTVYKFSAR